MCIFAELIGYKKINSTKLNKILDFSKLFIIFFKININKLTKKEKKNRFNMSLEAMLAQYETNSQTTSTGPKKEADMKNYFTTYLKDGEKTKNKRVRILPPNKAGNSPFVEVYVHSIQVEGQWRKFICPKHEKDEACPFCEAREQLLASTGPNKESDKELAKKYGARKMYVVKLIDREFESEGPKFWRFNHDYRKTGILDKIQVLLQSGIGDFSHPLTGRDLFVQIARDQNNRPVVQGIASLDSSPLSTDEALAKSWMEDERTWEDVYTVKGYDYLEIIVKGGVPFWDKEGKKYVDKLSIDETQDSSEDELTIGGNGKENDGPIIETEDISFGSEDTDDLPF